MKLTKELWNLWLEECDYEGLKGDERFLAVMKKGVRLHLKDNFDFNEVRNIMRLFQIPGDGFTEKMMEWTVKRRLSNKVWNTIPEFRKTFMSLKSYYEFKYLDSLYGIDSISVIDDIFYQCAKQLSTDDNDIGFLDYDAYYNMGIRFFIRTQMSVLFLKAGSIMKTCRENGSLNTLKDDLANNMDFSGIAKTRFFSDLFFDIGAIFKSGIPFYLEEDVYKIADIAIEASKFSSNMNTIWTK